MVWIFKNVQSMDGEIRQASVSDKDLITELISRGYRGQISKAGGEGTIQIDQ